MGIFKKIAAMWSKAAAWFMNLVKTNDTFVKKYAPVAIDVVNWIKDFNGSPAADILQQIVDMTGNKYGALAARMVRKWISLNIDKVIDGLNISEQAASATSISDKIRLVSQYVSTLPLKDRSKVLTTMSAELAYDLQDGELQFAEIVSLIKYIYDNKEEK